MISELLFALYIVPRVHYQLLIVHIISEELQLHVSQIMRVESNAQPLLLLEKSQYNAHLNTDHNST